MGAWTAGAVPAHQRLSVGSCASIGHLGRHRRTGVCERVSDDQIHRARLVVARNCDDPDDLRRLLDMLGLIAAHPDQPPPVGR